MRLTTSPACLSARGSIAHSHLLGRLSKASYAQFYQTTREAVAVCLYEATESPIPINSALLDDKLGAGYGGAVYGVPALAGRVLSLEGGSKHLEIKGETASDRLKPGLHTPCPSFALALHLGFERAQSLEERRFGSGPPQAFDLGRFGFDLLGDLARVVMIIGQCGMHFRQREICVLPRNLLGRPTAPLVVHDYHGHPCAWMSLQPGWFAGILYDMRVGQLYRHESKVADWIEDVNWTLDTGSSSHYGDSARNPLQIRSPAAPQTSPSRERTRAHPPGFFTKEKTNASAPKRELDAAQSHPKPPQGHHRATTEPPQSHILWSTEPPQGHPKATPRPPTPARLNASLMQPRATQSHLKATSRPPQGHLKATTEPYTLEYRATPRLPQGYPKATSRLPQGYPKATPRLPQGYLKATSRLPQGYPKATPKPGERGESREMGWGSGVFLSSRSTRRPRSAQPAAPAQRHE